MWLNWRDCSIAPAFRITTCPNGCILCSEECPTSSGSDGRTCTPTTTCASSACRETGRRGTGNLVVASMPDDKRSAERAREALVEILDQPRSQLRHRQRHVSIDPALDGDRAAARAPGFDLVGQCQDDRRSLEQVGIK